MMKIAACCALIGASALAAPLGARCWHLYSYARQRAAGAELIESLRDRRPAAVPKATWDNAMAWAITAYHNVCFSDEHVTYKELVRFTHDARIKLAEHGGLESVDWVWARLGRTGPHGKQYVAKFEPVYREQVYGSSVNNAAP